MPIVIIGGGLFLFALLALSSIPQKKKNEPCCDNCENGLPCSREENQNGEIMPNMISQHFSYNEMVKSKTASRLGIANIPTEQEIQNAKEFAVNVLEKVRALFGVPITINSWFRSRAVNSAIPGSANDSVHLTGFAADIAVPQGYSKVEAFKMLIRLIEQGGLQVGELIIYRDTNHFHITMYPHGGRNEILIAKKEGGPKYIAWSEENWINGVV